MTRVISPYICALKTHICTRYLAHRVINIYVKRISDHDIGIMTYRVPVMTYRVPVMTYRVPVRSWFLTKFDNLCDLHLISVVVALVDAQQLDLIHWKQENTTRLTVQRDNAPIIVIMRRCGNVPGNDNVVLYRSANSRRPASPGCWRERFRCHPLKRSSHLSIAKKHTIHNTHILTHILTHTNR